MEMSEIDGAFNDTRHPYTAGLLASLPSVSSRRETLYSIPGTVPDLRHRPAGCVFHPRCGLSAGREACRTTVPELSPVAARHLAACHFADETRAWATRDAGAAPAVVTAPAEEKAGSATLVLDRVRREFSIRRAKGWGRDTLVAVNNVSLEIREGETLGLVGESGCGKSTLGRVILGLHPATSGVVTLKGKNLQTLSARQFRAMRRELQVVFQDPYASLDPRMTIADIVAEPLRINRIRDPGRVAELLRQVGLDPAAGARRPSEFSGGQRQRIAIARALALRPDLLILDEAVSALDVSIQAQIVNLLKALQKELGLSYLFVSHDLSVVRHIADRVAVMYLGRIVETGTSAQVFDAPAHPYTQALLSAIPKPTTAQAGQTRIILKGDPPDPLKPPSGCVFRTRCHKAAEMCARLDPELSPRTGAGHLSACHFAGADPGAADIAAQCAPQEQGT
jgi:peptide/nickel transport system ATP-binding protein